VRAVGASDKNRFNRKETQGMMLDSACAGMTRAKIFHREVSKEREGKIQNDGNRE